MRTTDIKRFMEDLESEIISNAKCVAQVRDPLHIPSMSVAERATMARVFRAKVSATIRTARGFSQAVLAYAKYRNQKREFDDFLEQLESRAGEIMARRPRYRVIWHHQDYSSWIYFDGPRQAAIQANSRKADLIQVKNPATNRYQKISLEYLQDYGREVEETR